MDVKFKSTHRKSFECLSLPFEFGFLRVRVCLSVSVSVCVEYADITLFFYSLPPGRFPLAFSSPFFHIACTAKDPIYSFSPASLCGINFSFLRTIAFCIFKKNLFIHSHCFLLLNFSNTLMIGQIIILNFN
jgi:hypothetical protein